MATLLVSFPNQVNARTRVFSLAAFDSDRLASDSAPRWLRCGAGGRDLGVCGLAQVGNWLFCLVQSKTEPSLSTIDLRNWRLHRRYPCRYIRDPHSLAWHDGALYAVSTGNNAIVRIEVNDGSVTSEHIYWRHQDSSSDRDDIHVNSLAFEKGELFVTYFGQRNAQGRWQDRGALYNVDRNEILVDGLSQPHSLVCHDNRYFIANSFNGEVIEVRYDDSGRLVQRRMDVGGYARGLVLMGDDLLVGVSAWRQISKSTGQSNPVLRADMKQSGLMRLELQNWRIAPCMDLSAFGPEIYDLCLVDAALPPLAAAPSGQIWLENLRNQWHRLRS